MQVHLDHCIEILRVSAVCTADLRVYFFSGAAWMRPSHRQGRVRRVDVSTGQSLGNGLGSV